MQNKKPLLDLTERQEINRQDEFYQNVLIKLDDIEMALMALIETFKK